MKTKYESETFRPVSAVNKLGRIKKNIIPNLIQSNLESNKKEHSLSPNSFIRIKSAHPLKLDRERLAEENLSLKNQLNKIRNDMIYSKKEIFNLETEIQKKDKIIEDMLNESQADTTFNKASETHLVINLKKQYKELKKDNEKQMIEIDNLKRNIKSTKINELETENKILIDQVYKLKNLYEHSKEHNHSIESNIQTINIMKEALSKQDMIIINFQDNYQKMQEEINILIEEREKITKAKNDKIEIISKLKQKLKLSYQINEKLVMTKDNIKNNDAYIEMKTKFEKKLQQCRKDLAYYKDSNSKNEHIIREMKKYQNDKEKSTIENTTALKSFYTQRTPISASNSHINNTTTTNNNNKNESSSEQNSKMLLLQSKYIEQKSHIEKLQKSINELEILLASSSKKTVVETKVVLATSNSNKNMMKKIEIIDNEYMSDYTMNEFIYILIKNLEANKIDMSIIESRVLTADTLNLLKNNNDNYKSFILAISASLCEIIKVEQEKDQAEIHSFIRTFLYNYYLSKKLTNPEDFKTKLLSLFDNINFYSIEQKTELNRIICKKLSKAKEELITLLHFFDNDNCGYITFTILKKIMEDIKLKLKNESLEYFIYVMKCFPEEGRFIRDLKYDNLIKILEETSIGVNEEEVKDNDEKEDDAIEITNEEYLNKVTMIIGKIVKVLDERHKTVDDYFLKGVSKSIADYKGIELIKLVDILKNDFNIELTHIEIFCLFTKVKPGTSMSKDYEDTIEEIIDFDKLKKEIESYMKNRPKEIPQPTTKGKNKNKINDSDDSNNSDENIRKPLSYSQICNKAKEKKLNVSNENEDTKDLLMTFMKKRNMTFERFIFPIHCMMKLTSNGKKYNRYIDIEFFKHFLYQSGLLIHGHDLLHFCNQDRLMLNNEMLNIDYLKFVLSGQKGIRDIKVNDYMIYKPMYDNEALYQASTAMHQHNSTGPGDDLQKEIYGDDDDDLVHISKS